MTCTKNGDSRLRRLPMQERKLTTVLSMGSEQDISKWERLDDVIMGGQSSSSLKVIEDEVALFSGNLILEGGGFCGARTKVGIQAQVHLAADAKPEHLQPSSVTELA